MNDERLFERLAKHGGPVEVDGTFEDRLYAVVQREMDRPQRTGAALLLVAALLAAAAITGAVAVGSGTIQPPWVNRLVLPTHSAAASKPAEPSPPPTPSPGPWTATAGILTSGRVLGTATLLQDGSVLVAGGSADGSGGSEPFASAELFDPASGSWLATGSMRDGRQGQTATLLRNGTVLVTGGYSDAERGPALISAELYDPITGTWTATADMNQARSGHTATMLPDGRVLVAGGLVCCASRVVGDRIASAEVYDPVAGTWTATADMSQARDGHTATLLPDGRVLVAGGHDTSAELYDPATGTWAATADMTEPFYGHTATLLMNGTVLVAGGAAPSGPGARAWPHVEVYDPATGTWAATASMVTPRLAHTATLLPDGRVLVTGGRVDGSSESALLIETELYDPVTGRWTATSDMIHARSGHSATLLADGRVLVSGGAVSDLPASAELFDPIGGTR